jgi:hypothetical protein
MKIKTKIKNEFQKQKDRNSKIFIKNINNEIQHLNFIKKIKT